jgi:hypothetical protein
MLEPHGSAHDHDCFFLVIDTTLQMSQRATATVCRILNRGACTEIAFPNPATHASLREALIKDLMEGAANQQNSCKGPFGVGSGEQLRTTYGHSWNHQAARQGRGRSGMQLAPCRCGLPFLACTTDESPPGSHMPIGQGTAPKPELRLGELRCCVSKRWASCEAL